MDLPGVQREEKGAVGFCTHQAGLQPLSSLLPITTMATASPLRYNLYLLYESASVSKSSF